MRSSVTDASAIGSIPARAGKPLKRGPLSQPATMGLSPPVRGSPNRTHLASDVSTSYGLSPPVRGSLVLHWHARDGAFKGLSPPAAGKPSKATSWPARVDAKGLSPPVRGSPYCRCPPDACCSWWVYPRPCGEARLTVPLQVRRPPRVYPRPCGEATVTTIPDLSLTTGGLSPPVRGSPMIREADRTSDRVYPRPCGEAVDVRAPPVYESGLSRPCGEAHSARARNQEAGCRGSIPARAGKPGDLSGGDCARLQGVYPRPCGEAARYETG